MSASKILCLPLVFFILIVAAACAPAPTIQPTLDAAMMAKETDTAMMAKETDTAAMMMQETDTAMMAKETDTAMMAKETGSAAMMAKETDTAMMAKETDSAAMMAKETDTAMMMKETDTAMMAKTPEATPGASDAMMALPPQQFAAHFVDSVPMHEAVLSEIPELVLLNFNFTLSDASTITIDKDGKEIKTGAGKLGDKKLSMTSMVPQDMGAGVYVVKYKACWPDNSCHDGQFAFVVK